MLIRKNGFLKTDIAIERQWLLEIGDIITVSRTIRILAPIANVSEGSVPGEFGSSRKLTQLAIVTV
jgi:hypothetical protein